MNFERLKQLIAPLYKAQDPTHRWDHAERLMHRVRRWAEATDGEADAELAQAIAALLAIRQPVLTQLPVRTSVEAAFVESGWSALKFREMMRSLQRLPDMPKSLEEKLVADADTLDRLGLIGLVRELAGAANRGEELASSLLPLRKVLARKIHTPVGAREAQGPREALRELTRQLESELQGS